uniref:NADH-ubiquinone oxidoreductase chain 1 n=1 Tax=Conchocele cf. bisecta HPD1644 TaxID=1872713 RepID=A0A1B4WRI3_9BIVA|nr:NADH dehydrogenase subunit 1 [Conchocele cf. bisecta HPD1644]
MFVSVFCFVLCLVFVLMGVAFYTLYERKGLSYSQRRKGPNKVSLKGLPQPMSDAIKLFMKEYFVPMKAGAVEFMVGPFFMLFLALVMWWPVSFSGNGSMMVFSMIFFLCVSSLGVYSIFLMGWCSNSKYSVFGAMRAVAQVISYEVVIILLIVGPVILSGSFNTIYMSDFGIWFGGVVYLYLLIWFFTCLAETNRSPFDFVEGESELVSGFNVEYGGVGFAMIFMAEYANIIFISLISALLFCGGGSVGGFNIFSSISMLKFIFFILGFMFFVVQARASYPRYRYDLLMNLTWKKFLPLTLGVSMVIFSLM